MKQRKTFEHLVKATFLRQFKEHSWGSQGASFGMATGLLWYAWWSGVPMPVGVRDIYCLRKVHTSSGATNFPIYSMYVAGKAARA